MIKTYMPEGFKFILTHPELFMLKGISYTWSSVRSFHVHITKQGRAVSPGMVRCGWNSPSLNTRTYVLRPPLVRPPRPLLLRARSRTRIKKIGVVCNGRTLVIAIRKKTLIPRDTSAPQVLCLYLRPSYASLYQAQESCPVNILTKRFHAIPLFPGPLIGQWIYEHSLLNEFINFLVIHFLVRLRAPLHRL